MQLVKRLGGVVEVGVGSNPDGDQLVLLNSSTIHCFSCTFVVVVVVVLLFYIHGKHLRSCRDGQLT